MQLAQDAGFTAAMCSDHFHSWSERQGQSGFAWTWLGAALPTRLTSPDIEAHLEWLHADAALGFDRIYLHNVARDHQERLIEQCGVRLLPSFADGR